MALEMLCPQALIFVLFSMTHIVMDTLKQKYNSAFVKIWVSLIYTLVLNLLCQRGLGTIAWFLILIPFVLMTTIVGLILLTFGINEANDELNIFNKGNETTVVELPLFSKGRNVSDALRREIEEERLRAEKNSQYSPSASNSLTMEQINLFEDTINYNERGSGRNSRNRNKLQALEDIQDENDDARLKVMGKSNELEEIYKKYIKTEIRMYKCISDKSGEGEQKSEENVNKLKKDFNDLKTKGLAVAEELYNLSNKWVNKSVKYVEMAQLYGDAQDKRLAEAQRNEANEYVSNSHRVKTQKFKDDLDCPYKPMEGFIEGSVFSKDDQTKVEMELAKLKEDATTPATVDASEVAPAEPAETAATDLVGAPLNPQESEANCEKWAVKNGMKVGGGGYKFSGDYATKGCYYYSGGKYDNMTFWGTKVGKCETKGEHICADSNWVPHNKKFCSKRSEYKKPGNQESMAKCKEQCTGDCNAFSYAPKTKDCTIYNGCTEMGTDVNYNSEMKVSTTTNGFSLMGTSIQDSNETILSLGKKKKQKKRKRKPALLPSKFSNNFSDINVKKLLAPAWQYMGLPELRKGLMGK